MFVPRRILQSLGRSSRKRRILLAPVAVRQPQAKNHTDRPAMASRAPFAPLGWPMHEQDQSSESDEIELVWPKEQEKPTAVPRAQTGSPSHAKSEPATQEESVFRPARGREGPSGQPKRRKSRKTRRSRPAEASARSLISALWYPATGGGIFVILLYAFLFPSSRGSFFLVITLLWNLFVLAYVGLLFLETAAFTLAGLPQGPRLPGLSWGNFTAGMYALVAVVIARTPLFLGMLVMDQMPELPVAAGVLVVVILSATAFYYLPMAFLALAELAGNARQTLGEFRYEFRIKTR